MPRLQWEGVTVHEAMLPSSSNTSLCLCLLVSILCSKMRMSSMMYIHHCVCQPLCIDAGLLLTKVSDSVLSSAHPVANVAWTPCRSHAMTSAVIPSDYTQRCLACRTLKPTTLYCIGNHLSSLDRSFSQKSFHVRNHFGLPCMPLCHMHSACWQSIMACLICYCLLSCMP